MSKNVPRTVKASIAISIVQIVVGTAGLIAYHFDSYDSPNWVWADPMALICFWVFVPLLMVNVLLVVWETVIAFKTKQIFWPQYSLFVPVIVITILAFTTHPHCGCGG